MLSKPKTTGAGKTVRFKRRKQKRNPRRPLEAVAQDFERWDAAAARVGLNWSEFTRRALNMASLPNEGLSVQATIESLRELSEKPGAKKRPIARAKMPAKR